jgi:hypothetical protein
MTQAEFNKRYDHIDNKFTRTCKIISDARSVFDYLIEKDTDFKKFVDEEEINNNDFFMYYLNRLVFGNFRQNPESTTTTVRTCSFELDKVSQLIEAADIYFKLKESEERMMYLLKGKSEPVMVEDDTFS